VYREEVGVLVEAVEYGAHLLGIHVGACGVEQVRTPVEQGGEGVGGTAQS